MIEENRLQWIINTPEPTAEAKVDEIQMRAQTVANGIPITTTISGMEAAIDGLKAIRESGGRIEVCSLQEYHRHALKLDI